MTALPGAVIRYARKAPDGQRLDSLTSSAAVEAVYCPRQRTAVR